MRLQSITLAGKKGKEIEVAGFEKLAHPSIVAQAVRVYLANQRAGTAKTKTRGEVALTKKKIYKQKGTGNARHGAQSAPIFVGGGVTHGPHGNANWSLNLSKKMKQVALRTAIGMQMNNGKVSVVEGLDALGGKTSEMVKFLDVAGCKSKATLLIVDKNSEAMNRATDNIEYIFICPAESLTTYFVARAQYVFVTPEGLEILQKRLGKPELVEKKKVVEKQVKKPRRKSNGILKQVQDDKL